MANYVLSPAAARRLREMMRGRMVSGRIDGDASHVVDERGFAHPFTLTYAASAGAVDEETGKSAGAWIIWVPPGSLVIDGDEVDLASTLTAADNYPTGWYDLTEIFDSTDPDDFDLYLDASKDDPKFVIAQEDAENPVLIAKVEGKAVKGIVESALVFSKGGNKKPFDIVDDELNGVPVKKVVRCRFDAGAGPMVISDAALTLHQGGTSVYVVARVSPPATSSGTGQLNIAVECCDLGDEPTVDTSQSGHENDTVHFAPLYDLDGDGSIVCDYRDAWVTIGWIGVDNKTVSYGDDGQHVSYLHLNNFYNSRSDVSSLSGMSAHALVRVSVNGVQTLAYAPLGVLVAQGAHDAGIQPGGGGGGGGMFAWTAATKTIGPGGVMVGRQWVNATGVGANKADGLYHVKVTLTSSGASAEVVSGVSLGQAPSGNISYIPIYQITNGEISADYRGAFVTPVYE